MVCASQTYAVHYGGGCLAVVEQNMSGKMDWMSRADCMACQLLDQTPVNFFLGGTSEGAHSYNPSQDYQSFHGNT